MPGIGVISDSTWSFRPVTRNFSVVSCITPPWCLSVEKEVYIIGALNTNTYLVGHYGLLSKSENIGLR